MNIARRLILIALTLIVCVGCDQITKIYAEAALPATQPLSYLADTVRLQVAHNGGAFLSLGASKPAAWRTAGLTFGVGAVLIALLAYVVLSSRNDRPTILALSLILSGGIGNLIDRFTHDGYVVDFLNIGIGSLRTGIFNVADMAIMLGGGILLLLSFRTRSTATEPH